MYPGLHMSQLCDNFAASNGRVLIAMQCYSNKASHIKDQKA